jgi:hypothetical protein
VALPLAQDLLSSLAALSFSNKEHEFNDEGKEGATNAAKLGLRLRLVLTFSNKEKVLSSVTLYLEYTSLLLA